ncbi:uncharacterized protein [Clytia hemisphaerica]|uniref:uncharacterized protein n=1 Tax=Clytia hemisphaerica TaxID=252671 RepID=UPI0034D6D5D1
MVNLLGIALGLNKNLKIVDEEGVSVVCVDDTSLCTMPFILTSGGCLYLAAFEDYDPESCRSHNMYCYGREDEEQVVCRNCHLAYHLPCIRWQDTCGCDKIENIKLRLIDMFHERSINTFLRLIYKSTDKIIKFSSNLLDQSQRSARSELVVRLLSEGKCDALMLMNTFSKQIPQQIVRTLTSVLMASPVLEGNRSFQERNHQRVITEFLVPEVLTYLIQIEIWL